MPTTVTKTVKSSGGDYSSLSAWEAGEQGDLPTLDQIKEAACYSMQDTTIVQIDGWTTDATRYIRIFTPATERHAGKWDANKYHMAVTATAILTVEDNCRFEGLQIQVTNSSGTSNGISTAGAGGTVEFLSCIIRAVFTGTATGNGLNLGGTGQAKKVRNCIVYDWNLGTFDAGVYSNAGTAFVYNCTTHNCKYGFFSDITTSFHIKNCLTQDCATDGFAGTFNADATNNCSDFASDVPGSAGRTGEVTFADEGNDDFHLANDDTVAKGRGANLSADADYAFSDDIDGETRAGWDIGADENKFINRSTRQDLFVQIRRGVL